MPWPVCCWCLLPAATLPRAQAGCEQQVQQHHYHEHGANRLQGAALHVLEGGLGGCKLRTQVDPAIGLAVRMLSSKEVVQDPVQHQWVVCSSGSFDEERAAQAGL